MLEEIKICGRLISSKEVGTIRRLIRKNPTWHRTRLSQELCQLWDWKTATGGLKDMSCRNLLLRLERKGHLQLPTRVYPNNGGYRKQSFDNLAEPVSLDAGLKDLCPLNILCAEKGEAKFFFESLLHHYHYLSYFRPVGENLKYLITDSYDRPLGCVLFGSAAWKTEPRDTFIGWDRIVRERRLHLITNNTRFLILPWVRVPHLASHVLGQIVKRIKDDWIRKYGHPIYMLETFVDRDRFLGTCYRAANWIRVGSTKGRTRNDRYTRIKVSYKDIYLYPLTRGFRKALQS